MTDKPKTVRVRIAVAVDQDGDWAASGHSGNKDPNMPFEWILDDIAPGESRYYVEADLPVPVMRTVQGDVTQARAAEEE